MTLTWKHCNLPNKMILWLQLTITTKYQGMNKQPMKTKNKQIHWQIKIHNEHLKNITKIDKNKKTEQLSYDGAQNRTQLHFGEPGNKHTQIKRNKGVTKKIEHISNNNSQRF